MSILNLIFAFFVLSISHCSWAPVCRLLSLLSVRVLDDGLPFQDFSNLTFIYWLACVVELEFVLGATHAENLEAVDFGDESRRRHHHVVVVLQEHVRETRSEVSSINVKLLLSRQVHVHFSRQSLLPSLC